MSPMTSESWRTTALRQKQTLTARADFAREAGPTGRRDPIGQHAELVVASLAVAGRMRARMPAAFFRDPQSRSAARWSREDDGCLPTSTGRPRYEVSRWLLPATRRSR